MVPGSTLMYGSNFCSRTRRPRCSSSMPIEALVRPLPRELTTPPVTKMCLATPVFLGMKGQGEHGIGPAHPRHNDQYTRRRTGDQLAASGRGWYRGKVESASGLAAVLPAMEYLPQLVLVTVLVTALVLLLQPRYAFVIRIAKDGARTTKGKV